MSKYRNPWVLILLLITGVVLGSLIGTSLGKMLPLLTYGPGPMGVENLAISLGVIYFNLTLLIDVNVASLLGLLLAVLIFNRL